MIAKNLQESSKETLKAFTLVLPSASTCRKDLKAEIQERINFVEKLEILP